MADGKRTVRISLENRGQTTQDFAVGIGVFLLAIGFVFSFLPTFITPFSGQVGPAESAQADRIAATVVDDLAANPNRPNHLSEAPGDRYDEGELNETLGLRSTDSVRIDQINISIEDINQSSDSSSFNPGSEWEVGDRYQEGQTAASAARIVSIDEEDCDPACRLVVRIW